MALKVDLVQEVVVSPTVRILELFGEERLVISAATIADELSMTRRCADVYINALVRDSYLEECGGGFQLGPRLLDLARLARRKLGLSAVALPWMRGLAADLGQVVALGSRFGTKVLCSEVARPPDGASPITIERGMTFPLNYGSGAYVLLAWLSDTDVDDVLRRASLPRVTAATITNHATMKARLAVIREMGYAVSRGEIHPDLGTVAAPIRGMDGHPRAAVATVGLLTAFTDNHLPEIAAQVVAAANAISDRLILLEK